MTLRPATTADRSFLTAMLAEAASWEREPGEPPYPLVDLLGVPGIADYIEGWGRPGDFGVVAEEAGAPVGACWCRRFTSEHPGYGFIAEDVPGLSIGVVPAHRGRGSGRSLLTEVVDEARRRAVRCARPERVRPQSAGAPALRVGGLRRRRDRGRRPHHATRPDVTPALGRPSPDGLARPRTFSSRTLLPSI